MITFKDAILEIKICLFVRNTLIFELRDYFVGEIVFVSNIYWSNVNLQKKCPLCIRGVLLSIFYDKIMINKKTAQSLLLKWVRKPHNCYEHRFTTVCLFLLQANGNFQYRNGCVRIQAEIKRLFFKARGKRSQQSKYHCSKGVTLRHYIASLYILYIFI